MKSISDFWKDICLDCGHALDTHDEEGVCTACSDALDAYLPGGLQGANIPACPSLETES